MNNAYRYKNGIPIKDSLCYDTPGYNLTIKEVKEKDAGVFTIALSNQEKGIHRNISYTLLVKGRSLNRTTLLTK